MDLQKKIEAFDEQLMQHLPAIDDAEVFVDGVIDYLFPIRAKIRNAPVYTELKEQILLKQWQSLLLPLSLHLKSPIDELSVLFFEKLSAIFDQLKDDAQAILDFDPASVSLEEVLVAYPGFYAVAVYRIAHSIYELHIPFIPRLLTEHAHSKTGIDIHPGARIGRRFFIDHGTGVVIGETTEIGEEVKIYQGVTLGALQVSKAVAKKKRHPTIEDRVTIYAGSTILGGDTVIGHDTIVGGNVWLTEGVAPYSLVYAKHEARIRTQKEMSQPINFVI